MKCTCPNCGHEFVVSTPTMEDSPLRLARRESGLTVSKVAEELKLSEWSLQNLERGQMDPRMSTIRLASRLFNKSAEELFPFLLEDDDESLELPEATDTAE